MSNIEVIYPDGSRSEMREGGGAVHDGGMAIDRIRLITARQALEVYIRHEGKMQLTRNGHRLAVLNVIEPLSGKTFSSPTGRVSMKNAIAALAECDALLAAIHQASVVWTAEEES